MQRGDIEQVMRDMEYKIQMKEGHRLQRRDLGCRGGTQDTGDGMWMQDLE